MERFLVPISVLIISAKATPKYNILTQLFDHLLPFVGQVGSSK